MSRFIRISSSVVPHFSKHTSYDVNKFNVTNVKELSFQNFLKKFTNFGATKKPYSIFTLSYQGFVKDDHCYYLSDVFADKYFLKDSIVSPNFFNINCILATNYTAAGHHNCESIEFGNKKIDVKKYSQSGSYCKVIVTNKSKFTVGEYKDDISNLTVLCNVTNFEKI